MATKTAAKLQAELDKIDDKRKNLNARISTFEQERVALMEEGDRLVQEKQPLVDERRQLQRSLEEEPPTKKQRGRPRQEATAAAPASASEPNDVNTAAAGKAAAGKGKATAGKAVAAVASKAGDGKPAAAAGKGAAGKATAGKAATSAPPTAAAAAGSSTADGSIVPPTDDEALAANADVSLYFPTFMNRQFRESRLLEHAKSPGTKGKGKLLSCLVSRNASRESGVDGFIMWIEEWGRRNSYDVELLGLGYASPVDDPTDSRLAQRLISRMFAQLDATKSSDVRTGLSEKAKPSEHQYWNGLGFHGIAGGSCLVKGHPDAHAI